MIAGEDVRPPPPLPEGADVFLVGGAVRDRLLGRPVKERDWVVVGATPEAMLAAGYRQVGRDFPVFLHPGTSEEYALARTERKRGRGYTGFEVHYAPDVSLEDDLRRRDLTVNAMAMTAEGVLVDPYGGQADLAARVLRHVAPAFVEDPLRVLRVARFAARYRHRGFTVAPETLALMAQLVEAGELETLPPERVWTETDRALGEASPRCYVETLRACGALARLLPEVDALFGVPQRADYHPEVDAGLHTLMVLDLTASLSPDPAVRFSALLHDLGKALTPTERLPNHHDHDRAGLAPVRTVCERLRVPNRYRDLALTVCEHHLTAHRALELRPGTLLDLLAAAGALREPLQRFEGFLKVCEADKRGRLGREAVDYPQADYLRSAAACARAVTAATVMKPGLEGPAVGAAMREERLRRLAALRAGRSLEDLGR